MNCDGVSDRCVCSLEFQAHARRATPRDTRYTPSLFLAPRPAIEVAPPAAPAPDMCCGGSNFYNSAAGVRRFASDCYDSAAAGQTPLLGAVWG